MQRECKSWSYRGGHQWEAVQQHLGKKGGQSTQVHTVKEIEGHVSSYAAAAVHAVQEMRSDYLNTVDHLNWA